jgi:hypothetical protein
MGDEAVLMKIGTSLRHLVVVAATLCAAYAAGADPPASLVAPATATAGAKVDVKWTGPGGMLDVIVVVPAGSPDNTGGIGLPCYVGGSKDAHLRPAVVTLPEEPGEYELRYGGGGKLLARRRITVVAPTATVQAPATATAGSRISVSWTGVDVRVNVVGFAVDDDKLAAKFEAWSHAGGGSYSDARDAKSLSAAFTQAVRPAFELTDAQKNVVAKGLVGGDPVRVLPGTYAVTLKGHHGPPRSVTVRPRETSTLSY